MISNSMLTVFKAMRYVRRALSTLFWRTQVSPLSDGDIKFGFNCYLGIPKKIVMKSGTVIEDGVTFQTELTEASFRSGENLEIANDVFVDYTGGIEIGSNVLISRGATIYTHDHGKNPRSKPVGSPLHISDEAWIGTGSNILPSVSFIGKSSVVGAHSVLTKDVGDYEVWAGNPARLLSKVEVSKNVT